MKRMPFFVLLLLVLSLSGCIKTVEIDFPAPDIRPVVNCLFSPDTTFNLLLSRSASIFDSLPSPQLEKGALVQLFENGVLVDTMYFDGDKFSSHIIPQQGRTYHLAINHPNFGNIFAENEIPKAPVFEVSMPHDSAYIDEDGEFVSQVVVSIKDEPNVKNYYQLELKARTIDPNTGDTIFFYTERDSSDPVFENEGLNRLYTYKYVFSDELFDGQTYPLTLDYKANSFGNSYFSLVVILRAISEDYYLYGRSLSIHQYGQDDDIWESGVPASLRSNIEGGYGVFAGYNESVKIVNR